MFAKPYKLKSNNTLKNSEKKQLAQRIQSEFPATTNDKVKELVPTKSNSSCMKLVLYSGDTVGVYVVDGLPIMIDLEDRLVPTVCALWKVPDLIPTISIASLVLGKIQNGAPLYAPGVVADGSRFPKFANGSVVAACTCDNAAAGVVGFALMSSADLLRAPMGVCLETLHVFGDQLCKESKFVKIERPKLGPASYADVADNITTDLNQLSIQPIREEWPALGGKPAPVPNQPAVIADAPPPEPDHTNTKSEEAAECEELNDSTATDSPEAEGAAPADMDGLLRWCLLCFLRAEGKAVALPLKVSLLYRNHLMPYCPEDRTLDVKKSTYKKMGKFLEAMEREGLVRVREVEKGVDALVALEPGHPQVRAHRAAPARARAPAAPAPAEGAAYAPPQVRELYCVTAPVLPLFAPLRKGAALSGAEVRAALARRVRDAQLQRGPLVRLDGPLAAALGRPPETLVPWEELFGAVVARLTPSTELRFADGSVRLARSRLEPVRMQVVTRSGNKKVTLVSNLEAFGFSLPPLARACQLGVGAACGVTRSAAARADQLMLQGDQTHFVAKLLIEKYGLPKKFVEGADKALNKKK